jgi:hypothetical protein
MGQDSLAFRHEAVGPWRQPVPGFCLELVDRLQGQVVFEREQVSQIAAARPNV